MLRWRGGRRLKVRYLGDVVLLGTKFATNYDVFGYAAGSSIVVGIMKRFSVVKSIIIGYNTFSWQIIFRISKIPNKISFSF